MKKIENMPYDLAREVKRWDEMDQDVTNYLTNDIDSYTLFIIRKYLKKGIDLIEYVKKAYNWRQIEEIGLAILDKLDISILSKKELNHMQMKYIRYALIDGKNIKKLDLSLPHWEMEDAIAKL